MLLNMIQNNKVLHPDIIKKKSKLSGSGLFAKKDIPKGTIIWKFGNVRIYTKEQYDQFSDRYKAILRKYCYEGDNKTLVYCIDDSKYFNHSCNPNTMSINTEMDIAIKDIISGEEMTYDYGCWFLKWNEPFICHCQNPNCRHIIKREPPDSEIIKRLTHLAKEAERNLPNVAQPLLK